MLDVNTCAENSVIGDRAFGDAPQTCARYGAAWIAGLQSSGILACGKHFPGHGDTSKDSHIDLPVVHQSREHIEQVELAPFRAAVEAQVASMMTAHVVYPALDPARPATLSPAVCTELRRAIGFTGMLVRRPRDAGHRRPDARGRGRRARRVGGLRLAPRLLE